MQRWTQLSILSQLVTDTCRRIRPAQRQGLAIVDAVGLVTLTIVALIAKAWLRLNRVDLAWQEVFYFKKIDLHMASTDIIWRALWNYR